MISIIIPTYNEEGYIDATLRYFKENIKSTDCQIIVSDSSSKDRTAEVAQAEMKGLPANLTAKFVPMPEGKKRSISQGRNDGVAVATGDFIVFQDADVIIPQPDDFFAKALAKFVADPKLVAITARIDVEPAKAHISDNILYALTNACFAIFNNWFGFGIAAGEFQMIRMSAFRQTGGFNEGLPASEDIDLFRRLSKIGHTHFAWDLRVFHSGRRFRASGTWRTGYRWVRNSFSLWIFKKSADKEWETIR